MLRSHASWPVMRLLGFEGFKDAGEGGIVIWDRACSSALKSKTEVKLSRGEFSIGGQRSRGKDQSLSASDAGHNLTSCIGELREQDNVDIATETDFDFPCLALCSA